MRRSRLHRWCPTAVAALTLYVLLVLVLLTQQLVSLTLQDARRHARVHYCAQDAAAAASEGHAHYHVTRNSVRLLDVFTLYISSFFSSPDSGHRDVHPKLYQKLLNIHQTLEYEPFQITPPFFGDSSDERLFNENDMNLEFLGVQNKSKLRGVLESIPNGVAGYHTDCGWPSKISDYRQMVEWRAPQADVVVPLLVPDGFSFQHFLDGVLPKIMQAYDLIMLPGVKIALDVPRDQIIFELLNRLNISCDKIIFTSYIVSEIQINTCITPPVHPVLWQRARRKLGAPEHLPVRMRNALVILLTRSGSYNTGRTMLNYNHVLSYLRTRYGSSLHVFEGPYNLAKSMDLFGRARLLIGVHGGAFYNLHFCSMDTHLVEIMPVMEDGSPVPGIAHAIVWVMSQLLGQTFWRLHEHSHEDWGDVHIDLQRLDAVLNKIDRIQNVKYTKQKVSRTNGDQSRPQRYRLPELLGFRPPGQFARNVVPMRH